MQEKDERGNCGEGGEGEFNVGLAREVWRV